MRTEGKGTPPAKVAALRPRTRCSGSVGSSERKGWRGMETVDWTHARSEREDDHSLRGLNIAVD